MTKDVVVQLANRKFLIWTVAPSHFLVKNATIEMTASGANVVPTEPLVNVVHPWWERAAYGIAWLWDR